MNKGVFRAVVRIIGPGLCWVGLAVCPAEAAPLDSAPMAYVSNLDDSTVSVIDTSTNSVVATVPVPCRTKSVVITPDDAFVYANGETCIAVIATATNTVVATLAAAGRDGMAITPDGYFVYVVSDSRPSTVSVLATAMNTGTVVATIPVGTIAAGVAITPDGSSAYVANNQDNTVSVIDTTTKTVVSTIPVGVAPFGLAISPDGALVYVVNESQSVVSVIATATNTVVGTVDLRFSGNPTGAAFTPDGTFAYVTSCDGSVSVVATATNSVVAKIPVGSCVNSVEGVAFTADGAFAYVINTYVNTVSVIDTAALRVVATIPVGFHSSGIAIQRKLPLRLSTDHGGNGGQVTLTVFGQGIPVGSTSALVCAGQPVLVGKNNTVAPGGLTALFDLTGAAPGQCAVVLTTPDGATRTVPKRFTIEQGGAPNVWTDVVGVNKIRGGRPQTFFILVGNRGAVDAPLATVWVVFPNLLGWSLGPGQDFINATENDTQNVVVLPVEEIASQGVLVVPIVLTAPSDIQFGHHIFLIKAWAGNP